MAYYFRDQRVLAAARHLREVWEEIRTGNPVRDREILSQICDDTERVLIGWDTGLPPEEVGR